MGRTCVRRHSERTKRAAVSVLHGTVSRMGSHACISRPPAVRRHSRRLLRLGMLLRSILCTALPRTSVRAYLTPTRVMPNSRVPIQSMTREDWLRVKTITAAALEQPEARRPGFVTDACAGDQPLEQEVRSLLFSAVSASALFEAPVFAAASAINLIEQAASATAPRIGGRFG